MGCYAFRLEPRGAFSGCLAVGCRELFLNLGGMDTLPPQKTARIVWITASDPMFVAKIRGSENGGYFMLLCWVSAVH